MAERKYPQVLLLGNGLNRAYAAETWDDVIKNIWQNPRVDKEDEQLKELPYPLLAVLATDNNLHAAINEHSFATVKGNAELTAMLQGLLKAGFDHILTTNYTYELEAAAYPEAANIEKYSKELLSHTGKIERAETKYTIYTYNKATYQNNENKIWHIHGETRKKHGIVLGHYYYGVLLAKCQAYLKGNGNEQEKRQQAGKPPIMDSWLDAFVMGDVYVLGFGCHFSEMDIWWLINRKENEKADHGKIYFYEPSFGNELKHALLDTYGVTVLDLNFRTKTVDYKTFYDAAIADIAKRLQQAEKNV